jgi:hypothetical protein
MFHALAVLLILNMILFHSSSIADGYYFLHRKLIKPKFKLKDVVIINGDIHEVLHITTRGMPYSYFCLPLNSFNSRLGNYYPQRMLKSLPDLTKSLL